MGMLGCCSRSSTDVVPVVAVAAGQNGTAGPSSLPHEPHGGAEGARALAADSAAKMLTDGTGSVGGAAAAEPEPEPEPEYTFEVTVRSGNGTTFQTEVHDNLKVSDLHSQVARALGADECPLYAARLIYKTKVLSSKMDEPISTFGLDAGSHLQLVVVSAHRRPRTAHGRALRPSYTSARMVLLAG